MILHRRLVWIIRRVGGIHNLVYFFLVIFVTTLQLLLVGVVCLHPSGHSRQPSCGMILNFHYLKYSSTESHKIGSFAKGPMINESLSLDEKLAQKSFQEFLRRIPIKPLQLRLISKQFSMSFVGFILPRVWLCFDGCGDLLSGSPN